MRIEGVQACATAHLTRGLGHGRDQGLMTAVYTIEVPDRQDRANQRALECRSPVYALQC